MWYGAATQIVLHGMCSLKKHNDLKRQNNFNIKYVHVTVKCSELILHLLQRTVSQKKMKNS